jgi:DNA-directed RNA polymerase specialized sigma24 family protein
MDRNGSAPNADTSNVGGPTTPEWTEFRSSVVEQRKRLERALRRELVHDARSATARLQNVAVLDLADDALCRTLDEWRSKPGGTAPFQWMLKHALKLLDEALDREALAAESRREERIEEKKLVAYDLSHDDEERTRWLEMVELTQLDVDSESTDARGPLSSDGHQFDGLTSPAGTSDPDERFRQREALLELEQALLDLPGLRRRAIAHRFLDGLDVEEVAYLLDLEEDDAEIEISEALRTLREKLGPPN